MAAFTWRVPRRWAGAGLMLPLGTSACGELLGYSDLSIAPDASTTDALLSPDGDASPNQEGGPKPESGPDALDATPESNEASADGCMPECTGKLCGIPDGCGGHCTACNNGQSCNATTWACEGKCQGQCAGKVCGEPDGCGDVCTGCAGATEFCDGTLQCVDVCAGIACGHGTCSSDGRHGVCQCDPGYHERQWGQPLCVADGTPTCEGVTCSGHGVCSEGGPYGALCTCDAGYVVFGVDCVPEGRLGCRDTDNSFKGRGKVRCSADDTKMEVCRDANNDGLMEWDSGTPCADTSQKCSECMKLPCDVQPCPPEQVCTNWLHGNDYYECLVSCDCSNCGPYPPHAFNYACGSHTWWPTETCNVPCETLGSGCVPAGSSYVCYDGEGWMSAAPK
jgi:hypothetical protein